MKEIFKAKSQRRGTVKERSVCVRLVVALLLGEGILNMFIGNRKGISGKEELEYTGVNTLISENILIEN